MQRKNKRVVRGCTLLGSCFLCFDPEGQVCYCYFVSKSCPTLRSHGPQHARLACLSLSPRVCSALCTVGLHEGGLGSGPSQTPGPLELVTDCARLYFEALFAGLAGSRSWTLALLALPGPRTSLARLVGCGGQSCRSPVMIRTPGIRQRTSLRRRGSSAHQPASQLEVWTPPGSSVG